MPVSETWFDSKPSPSAELTCLQVWDTPPCDLLLNYVDPVILHYLLMHLSCHTVYRHLWIVLSKLSKSISRHDNESHMLPPASALRLNSSLLASFSVGSGLCFLRLVGNNFTGGSSSPSVANSFLDVSSLSTLRLSVQNFSNYLVAFFRLTAA